MDCRSGHADPMTEAFLQTAGVFSQLELAMICARVRSGMANASDNARMRQILQRTKTRKALVCKENPQSIEIAGFLFVVRVVIQNFLKKPVISTVFKADE